MLAAARQKYVNTWPVSARFITRNDDYGSVGGNEDSDGTDENFRHTHQSIFANVMTKRPQ